MSATTTPTTFLDLYTDAAQRLRVSTTDTTTTNILKRLINQGLHDLHIQRNWSWAERRTVLNTHATYTTGTVDIALATRTTVTGTATLWNTAVTGMGFNNARVGGKMTFSGATDVYTVSAVGSDTSITLADRYIGTAALSAATYTYFEDEYALASDFFRLVDARRFSTEMPIPVISRREWYAQYPRNSVTGLPRVCTIIDLVPSGNVSTQPRVVFHPAPDLVYNIPYRYITSNLATSSAGVAQVNLSADTDEPIIPLRYRHALVFYAIAQWYRDRKDDARSSEANGEYVTLVQRMAGDFAPEQDRPRLVPRRRTYLRGSAGYGAHQRGRYATGAWFDELQDMG